MRHRHKTPNRLMGFIPIMCVFLLLPACSDDADERSKFVGRYEVKESSLETYTQRDDYEVRIRKDAGTENMVLISNFYNLDVEVDASIVGNKINVIRQTHGVYLYEGSGTLSGSVIIMEYTVSLAQDDGELVDRLRAEMTLID